MDKKLPKKISLQDFGPARIILIALAGIILLVANVAEQRTEKRKEETKNSAETREEESSGDYVKNLENKLVHILEHVDGVGQVEVMITLESSGEAILNKDISEESRTEEENGENTNKTERNIKKEEETILSDGNGASAPYVVKQLKPEIAGVIISCEGADNNRTAAAVMEAAQVAFGIPSSHIKVLKMEVLK